jgi:hypothetical protein
MPPLTASPYERGRVVKPEKSENTIQLLRGQLFGMHQSKATQ